LWDTALHILVQSFNVCGDSFNVAHAGTIRCKAGQDFKLSLALFGSRVLKSNEKSKWQGLVTTV
jgi:hypothetical protein